MNFISERRNKMKEISKVAIERLDKVITEMAMSTSSITQLAFSGVAHDLVKIIKLAEEGEITEEDEET